jgi:hypothetical protein
MTSIFDDDSTVTLDGRSAPRRAPSAGATPKVAKPKARVNDGDDNSQPLRVPVFIRGDEKALPAVAAGGALVVRDDAEIQRLRARVAQLESQLQSSKTAVTVATGGDQRTEVTLLTNRLKSANDQLAALEREEVAKNAELEQLRVEYNSTLAAKSAELEQTRERYQTALEFNRNAEQLNADLRRTIEQLEAEKATAISTSLTATDIQKQLSDALLREQRASLDAQRAAQEKLNALSASVESQQLELDRTRARYAEIEAKAIEYQKNVVAYHNLAVRNNEATLETKRQYDEYIATLNSRHSQELQRVTNEAQALRLTSINADENLQQLTAQYKQWVETYVAERNNTIQYYGALVAEERTRANDASQRAEAARATVDRLLLSFEDDRKQTDAQVAALRQENAQIRDELSSQLLLEQEKRTATEIDLRSRLQVAEKSTRVLVSQIGKEDYEAVIGSVAQKIYPLIQREFTERLDQLSAVVRAGTERLARKNTELIQYEEKANRDLSTALVALNAMEEDTPIAPSARVNASAIASPPGNDASSVNPFTEPASLPAGEGGGGETGQRQRRKRKNANELAREEAEKAEERERRRLAAQQLAAQQRLEAERVAAAGTDASAGMSDSRIGGAHRSAASAQTVHQLNQTAREERAAAYVLLGVVAVDEKTRTALLDDSRGIDAGALPIGARGWTHVVRVLRAAPSTTLDEARIWLRTALTAARTGGEENDDDRVVYSLFKRKLLIAGGSNGQDDQSARERLWELADRSQSTATWPALQRRRTEFAAWVQPLDALDTDTVTDRLRTVSRYEVSLDTQISRDVLRSLKVARELRRRVAYKSSATARDASSSSPRARVNTLDTATLEMRRRFHDTVAALLVAADALGEDADAERQVLEQWSHLKTCAEEGRAAQLHYEDDGDEIRRQMQRVRVAAVDEGGVIDENEWRRVRQRLLLDGAGVVQ